MDIVIIADFCGQFDGTDNSRFLYLADLLSANHTVEVITSDFDHITKDYFTMKKFKESYKITMLHESVYKKNVCFSRFKAHYVWGMNVSNYLKTRKKPDIVYCAVPTLKASYEVAKYCKKNNVRFIIDIQDLWPEAFQMVFNIPIISNFVFKPFQNYVDRIYKEADEIIAVSSTYVSRALNVNTKCKYGHTVFLGTELKKFDLYVKENSISNKKKDEMWIGYCGTLGNSYDITCIIDAIKKLDMHKYSGVKFMVFGDGPFRAKFEQYAKKKGIKAKFTGKLPYPVMCGYLTACDIVVNPISKGAAGSIINKHADYAASGLPVISTQECEEYRNLVDTYKMGFNCNNNDAEDVAKKLKILLDDKDLRLLMGANARKCAKEKFDREKNYTEILNCINKI